MAEPVDADIAAIEELLGKHRQVGDDLRRQLEEVVSGAMRSPLQPLIESWREAAAEARTERTHTTTDLAEARKEAAAAHREVIGRLQAHDRALTDHVGTQTAEMEALREQCAVALRSVDSLHHELGRSRDALTGEMKALAETIPRAVIEAVAPTLQAAESSRQAVEGLSTQLKESDGHIANLTNGVASTLREDREAHNRFQRSIAERLGELQAAAGRIETNTADLQTIVTYLGELRGAHSTLTREVDEVSSKLRRLESDGSPLRSLPETMEARFGDVSSKFEEHVEHIRADLHSVQQALVENAHAVAAAERAAFSERVALLEVRHRRLALIIWLLLGVVIASVAGGAAMVWRHCVAPLNGESGPTGPGALACRSRSKPGTSLGRPADSTGITN